MVNFKKLSQGASRVKDLIDQQGGADAVKDKALRVKDIAAGEGTLSEKAKAAAEVAKERPETETETEAEAPAAEDEQRSAEKPEGDRSA